MTTSVNFEIAALSVLTLVLVADLALVIRRPHVPSAREAGAWVAFYVTSALAFAVLMTLVGGARSGTEFLAGWLTEYSLSVDNLFVFVVVMSRFAVPREQQQRVLMIGILLSLLLRGAFIVVGAEALARFSFLFYLFGIFLVYTAIQLIRSSGSHEAEEFRENSLIRLARRLLPISRAYDGGRLVTRQEGRLQATPMVLVLVAIGTTDVLFALDSIPAIFGLTTDAFIVFTATLFALMGLRQLYFLLGALLERLHYLSHGLSFILAFIGVKLVLQAMHENELPFVNGGRPVPWALEIPIWASLLVILVALVTATLFSLHRSRGMPARAGAG